MKAQKGLRFHSVQALGLSCLGLSLLSGCLSAEEKSALDGVFDLGGVVPSVTAPEVAPACFNERFVQPQAEISRSIDILFVMDTSGSMDDNRAKVASGISAFVGELPSNVDYQVGVMLAHGSKSSWSGKLFKYSGNTVFSSKSMTLSSIQSSLRNMVLNAPKDANNEQGEEGTYSLLRGLGSELQNNRKDGFFRSDAALAVVFVSDENDICAPYVDDPKMRGLTSAEKKIRDRDCKDGISSAGVIAKVKEVQGERPYLFGAVVHEEEAYKDSAGNDGYGFGYMELVQSTKGVSTEINNGDYTQGLSDMGKLATSKLNLLLDFSLARTDIDPASIQTKVDGSLVEFVYDAESNDVHLSSGGGALSVVDIGYCLKPVVVEPSPEPSPIWTLPPN